MKGGMDRSPGILNNQVNRDFTHSMLKNIFRRRRDFWVFAIKGGGRGVGDPTVLMKLLEYLSFRMTHTHTLCPFGSG